MAASNETPSQLALRSEDVIDQRLDNPIDSYTIGDRSVNYGSLTDRLKAHLLLLTLAHRDRKGNVTHYDLRGLSS